MTVLAETTAGVRVEDVRVGERARKDYGDLTSLKASIVEHGLLQPIVLLPDNYLLCGGRRLEACIQLGWSAIPFVRVSDQGDALSRLKAERDENTCRKDMTPSELVAIGRMLESLKRTENDQRIREAADRGRVNRWSDGLGANAPSPSESHATRREVAEAVGMGESTYTRAKRVVEAAEDETADPETRQIAVEALAAMDAGIISISKAEATVKLATTSPKPPPTRGPRNIPQAERVAQIIALAPTGATCHQIATQVGVSAEYVRLLARKHDCTIVGDQVMQRTRRIDSTRVVRETVNALEGLAMGIHLVNFDGVDTADIGHWVVSLTDSLRALNRFAKDIKELTQ